ncbi:flavin-containing monooxygenase [Caulobacter sp. KR2-114]|uniref:flavin-containing monooxygenase n=1 Tax=Caulobacter sp. KR2-114 TaxID=3400912 RepID=UPI003C049628
MAVEHFDVLVVGAGLSGIGAGYFLKTRCPNKRFAIFEGRAAMGGTWDLFRYPGIRSDSDMYTLGYAFKPWTEAKAIADGPSILKYVKETAAEYGLDRLVRYEHKVRRAAWSSADARWTIDYEVGPEKTPRQVTCSFLHMCTGYYSYARGYRPHFEGEEAFKGPIIEPQFWPQDLDYSGKRVVVIGSGATAMTLVPAMSDKAAHVTMLQRSPTYVVSRPAEDAFANRLRASLPGKLAYTITRWRNVLFGMMFFRMARKDPDKVKAGILKMVRDELGPDYDVDTHFTPRYNPWDQRLCLVPDADLFASIKAGRTSVVTDHIDHFTAEGIVLKSGQTLPADVVVSATGLDLQVLSGLEVSVDGAPVNFAETFNYKGMMFSGVPNLTSTFGYTNASWTLKADLTAEYLCRMLGHMDRHGYVEARPVNDDPDMKALPWLDFSSGYVTRAMDKFPKQGDRAPWKVHQNYALDLLAFRYGRLEDGAMRFSKAGQAPAVAPAAAEPEAVAA